MIKNSVSSNTPAFPRPRVAALPDAAVGLGGVAGIPEAQVTTETLQ